jgi:outer membrane lipoprotein carrier protein
VNRTRRAASNPAMRGLAVAACGLGLLGTAAVAEELAEPPACARAAVAAMQKRYESVEDLRAQFEQTSVSVAMGGASSAVRSRGAVVLAKPGKMRWTYREPEESLVVSDGRWLWLYDPARREAQKLPVGDGYLSAAAMQFLLGEGHILRDFRVAQDACSDREARLTLLPRQPASYEKLRVRVDLPRGDLLETEVVDLLGNTTRVAFREIEVNAGPAPETFTFTPPAGAQVIELEPSAAPR